MSRNVYTLAVLRWPQAQLVEAEAKESTEWSARQLLNELFETDQKAFAMYVTFMDGWDHTDHLFSRDPEESLFRLLGAHQLLDDLVRFHPNEIAKSKKLWKKYEKRGKKPCKGCLNQYAIDSMFHWLRVGLKFMDATDLPMLVAYDTIGATLSDKEFQVGVAPEVYAHLNELKPD